MAETHADEPNEKRRVRNQKQSEGEIIGFYIERLDLFKPQCLGQLKILGIIYNN